MVKARERRARTGLWVGMDAASVEEQGRYFSDELMSVNLVFRLEPRPLTIAMMASEMPAAISPYSIAVAPDSSVRKFRNLRFKSTSAVLVMRIFSGRSITGRELKAGKSDLANLSELTKTARRRSL